MKNKKYLFIAVSAIIVLWIIFVIMGREYPIHKSSLKVGNESIYYREISTTIQCDMAYIEVIVYDDGTYEYVYDLIEIGNGSCLSDLYIWDGLKSYRLSDAIDQEIISLDDFLESDFVIKRQITSE